MQLLYAVTLFVSACLLFVVQPMFAKMVLPLLGGTPAVWNTCMVFYQGALLAGYLYAHLSTRWLGVRAQSAAHLALMALPWLVLPIGVASSWTPPATGSPTGWLLLLLAVSVGLPFFIVSASAPMLQAWFARTGHASAKDPYYLYAASNLGSMVALLGYPFVLESTLTRAEQAWWWAVGYGLLMALIGLCALVLWRSARRPATAEPELTGAEAPSESLGWGRRLRWLALSLAPSSLLLGVTTHIATDLASVPLLWIVPLALYLLTFVLVFARFQLLPHSLMLRLQPLLVLPMAIVFFEHTSDWFWSMIALHLAAFFVTTMVCHGELARTRPGPGRLTEFYLWMSVGGVLGGLLNAVIAPTAFPWIGDQLWAFFNWFGQRQAAVVLHQFLSPNLFYMILEYPLMVAVACLLRPRMAPEKESPGTRWIVFGIPTLLLLAAAVMLVVLRWKGISLERAWHGQLFGRELVLMPKTLVLVIMSLAVCVLMARPVWFGLGVAAVLAVSFWFADPYDDVIYMKRSFFGVMRVSEATHWVKVPQDDGTAEEELQLRHTLAHGSTTHGSQIWDEYDDLLRNRPQSYYHPAGPLGDLFYRTANAQRRTEIGVVGLGTGSVAGYGKPGQRITYFEIDQEVVEIAEDPDLFTYLSDCEAKVEIVLGDARLRLQDQPDGKFDILVIDAFSSDSIPMHLMTREAMALYLAKLKPDGVLCVHVSNRYLALEPLVSRLADDAGLVARAWADSDVSPEEKREGKYASDWVGVVRSPEHLGQLAADPNWRQVEIPPGTPLWTDDFSNLLAALRRD